MTAQALVINQELDRLDGLWDDGLSKVAAGLTSIEELARVSV